MIPKITFRYSEIHDEMMKLQLETAYVAYKKPKTKKAVENYPSPKRIKNYILKIEPLWKKQEKRILQEISKLTNLHWIEKIIKVYVVGNFRPYSDPLTVRLENNPKDFIDILTHELIHQIQSQNSKIFKKWLAYMKKKYKKEKRRTKSHILLHAVHKMIYLRLFNKKRLNRNIKRSYRDSYKRAWEIVEEEGAENIIKKFREVIK